MTTCRSHMTWSEGLRLLCAQQENDIFFQKYITFPLPKSKIWDFYFLRIFPSPHIADEVTWLLHTWLWAFGHGTWIATEFLDTLGTIPAHFELTENIYSIRRTAINLGYCNIIVPSGTSFSYLNLFADTPMKRAVVKFKMFLYYKCCWDQMLYRLCSYRWVYIFAFINCPSDTSGIAWESSNEPL